MCENVILSIYIWVLLCSPSVGYLKYSISILHYFIKIYPYIYIIFIFTTNYLYFCLKQLHAQLMPAQVFTALKHGNYSIVAGQCISQSISTFKELAAFLYIWTSVIVHSLTIYSRKYNLYMQTYVSVYYLYIYKWYMIMMRITSTLIHQIIQLILPATLKNVVHPPKL